MAKENKITFEDSLKRLQEITEKLESDDLQLDDAIKLYEEGMKLSGSCYKTLSEAELKITKIKEEFDKEVK